MGKKGVVFLGPWGGNVGNPWIHKITGEISKITITYDDNGINSIRFVSKDEANIKYKSNLFGVVNGSQKEILINSKFEKLISVEGSVGVSADSSEVQVTSLGFTTTKTKHEPVGTKKKEDEFFSCLLSKDPIGGFHGHCGVVLNSIGIGSVELTKGELAGPWPNSSGRATWKYIPRGQICKIYVTHGDVLHSLQFASTDLDGVIHKSDIYGKPNGNKIVKAKIDTTIEKIIGISGVYGPHAGTNMVKSVTFITNSMKAIGPFGTQKREDTPFSYSVKGEGNLHGFHGTSGSLIHSIGVNGQPSQSSTIKVGPFALDQADTWDYEPDGEITRICVQYWSCVWALQFESIDLHGNKHLSERYGPAGKFKYTIEIENDDKITNISGILTEYKTGWYVIKLCIATTKYTYGPFGDKDADGVQFSFPIKNGYISGFHGISTDGLKALGVYVRPI